MLWLLPIGFVLLLVAVAVAKGLRDTAAVQGFIARHPGAVETTSARRHPGLPAWVGVQHFFNLFLLVFIIRSGLQILSDHPRLYWTRHSTPGEDWFRIQKPVPPTRCGRRSRTRSAFRGKSVYREFGTRSGWHGGGTSASMFSGCSTG